ncbi:hypothetical protein BB559_000550 [Furculomyces boomerangus]|uniref:P-type ATPase A domain-containing protein n=2 Tax=Harpellales TaxID=61421 RepID=A0A2T9Z4T5_9FUNG|nr:hypothetical protein BB559_000550 [Furculomyces boomerangus]PVZ97958.1 hypothetical protein BB558_006050 [Smittium angustum]
MGRSHPKGLKTKPRGNLSSHIEDHPYEELACGFDCIPDNSSLDYEKLASKQSGHTEQTSGQKPMSHSRKKALFPISVFALLFQTCLSEPVFNKVNVKQADGQLCPLVQQTGNLCPPLCVSDYQNCPKNFGNSSCPSGTSLCLDGSCSQKCDPLAVNPCTCGYRLPPEFSLSLFPCMTFSNISVSYDKNSNTQILTACEDKFDVGQNVGIWGSWESTPSNTKFWTGKFCPTQPMATYSYKEPMWVGTFSILGFELFLMIVWWIYKNVSESNVRKMRMNALFEKNISNDSSNISTPFNGSESKPEVENYSPSSNQQNPVVNDSPKQKLNLIATQNPTNNPDLETKLNIRGYNHSFFGNVGFYSILVCTLGWFAYLVVMVLDYYGVIGSFGHLAFGDFGLLNRTFVYIWCFTTAWVFTVRVFMNRIRNYFRIETLPSEAKYVQIEYKYETLVLTSDQENSYFFKHIKRAEENFKSLFGLDSEVTTIPVLLTQMNNKYFQYQCTRYVLNEQTLVFEPFIFNLGETNEIIRRNIVGLSSNEAQIRLELVGPNFIEVYIPNILISIGKEFTNIFYLYQGLILWLFYYLSYWIIGVIDTSIVIISAVVKVYVKRNSDLDVKKMAESEDFIKVLRDGQWVDISTKHIVSGDIYRIDSCKTIPCDSVILGGNAVIDESSLTGEPLPIRKFPLPDDNNLFAGSSSKSNFLFAGTNVTQTMVISGDEEEFNQPVALCISTGTQTDRGKLVQKILFPVPVSFIFNEQLRIVFVFLALYAIFAFGLGLWFLRASTTSAWYYGMFSVSQLINPLLPAALVVGQSVAASRLKKKHINCIDLSRIMMAGKVQVFCFDKTGTLTRDNLEYYGSLCPQETFNNNQLTQQLNSEESSSTISNKGLYFDQFKESFTDLPSLIQIGIATCHTTTRISDGRLIGNPVDIEMFKASKWSILDQPNTGALDTISSLDNTSQYDIVKRFEFLHARASMSVAVRDNKTGKVHVFVKGSFERLASHFKSHSIPEDYNEKCNALAREGGYVLAMGHRELENVDIEEIKGYTRDELEHGCTFIGLVVFKNMLKDDSTEAIALLKKGDIRTIMITGDTALTGIFIARKCEMAPRGDGMVLADLDSNGNLFWTDIDNDQVVSDEFVEDIVISWNQLFASKKLEGGFENGNGTNLASKRWELAMTGKAFGYFKETGQLDKYILNTRVFARMLPQDKVDCVKSVMKFCVTAMCGDGGNDCGALRVAHAGLALSDAEASIVSPFSSKTRSIMSCVELIVQGRAAMATSLAGYRFLILFGQSVTLIKIFTFYFSVGLSQNVWIMVDAFIAVGMSFTVSFNGPAKKLSLHRPTSRILGPQILLGSIGIVFINFLFLMGGFFWLYSKSWFRCNEFEANLVDISKWWLLGDNYETEIIAFIGLMQLVTSAFIVNFGYIFRRRWYRNYLLVIFSVSFVSILSYMLMADPNWLGCKMRFNCGTKSKLVSLGYPEPSYSIADYNMPLGHNVFPKNQRLPLLLICYANIIVIILWESVVIIGPIKNYIRSKFPLKRVKVLL